MEKKETRKAAPYSTTDEQETLAIDTFRHLIDHEKVKLDIKERDKYPNIDGYVEIVDELRTPIGKLEVQIRKLPNGKQKLQCPVSLFSYSEKACYPVLLIGVDTKQKIAYWVHVKKDLVDTSINGSKEKTKVIHFPTGNMIEGKNIRYVEDWKKIAESYQIRVQEYPKLKDLYEKLSERSNPALGIESGNFQSIHVFLDEINTLLDGKFSVVKDVFYPTAWKIGLAYDKYEDNFLSYTLYPIPFDKNDVQIKEIDAPLHKQLENEGLGFTAHCVENPIKLKPKEYAVEIVEHDTLKVLKNRLLNHHGNEFLAREFIFAFINKFLKQMGLDEKDKYSIDEIENATFQYLPLWVNEAIKFMVKVQRNQVKSFADLLYGKLYFNPDMLIHQIMQDERKQIDQTVREKLGRNDHIPTLPLGNDRISFRIFVELLSFLKSEGFQEIERSYLPRDYSRLKEKSGWVWNVFSSHAVEANLKKFFDNLPKVYDNLILQNFPQIVKQLPLFGDASLVVILFNVKEEYRTFEDGPTIKFFYLKAEDKHNLEIRVYLEGATKELPSLSHEQLGKNIEIDGKKYELVALSTGILDFIYEDLPMFNFVYKVLEENLKQYFNSLRA